MTTLKVVWVTTPMVVAICRSTPVEPTPGEAATPLTSRITAVASSFYHTTSYDVSGFATLEVEFYFVAVSMDNTREDFWVQYFDGSSWLTVATFARGIDFDNGVFYNVVVTIPSASFNFPTNKAFA